MLTFIDYSLCVIKQAHSEFYGRFINDLTSGFYQAPLL